jgi:hypothetical protein
MKIQFFWDMTLYHWVFSSVSNAVSFMPASSVHMLASVSCFCVMTTGQQLSGITVSAAEKCLKI